MIQWRKSSHSQGGGQGECVEVSTNVPAATLIQDSTNPGPHLALAPTRLAALVRQIKTGAFDLGSPDHSA
ncbi:DUF397 domain-containing protein [Actinomadura rayongensis]|uniref:DUF397 domain-containing protein n=1 Tax=Actinomadura rayongensis TaxID=1429076 RepID=A0A6I4WDC7_9ACTN|nr:DUF397 domain-containing protein [Actinomadura rayongensis]MXQ67728.1 DUF397 domain-containing protein [Actinomadura rayongensis]